jgi:predicted Holliday junction resolvase-like endonuclease
MNSDLLSISFVIILILFVIVLFIKIALRIRKYGGSLTTTMFASTYEFLNKDKREAVEEIVEMNANKKLEEEKSGSEF